MNLNLIARWRRRPALTGVVLGPEAVHLVQLGHESGRVQIVHHAREPLPPGALVEQQVVNQEAVGDALARAWARAGIHTRRAAVALAAPAAVLRLLSLPAALDEAEREAQLELEAARLLPVTDGPPHLDFAVLGPLPGAPEQVHVLLAVAHPAPVRQCVATLKYAGLTAVAVDVDALALARVLAVLAGQSLPPEQVIVLSRESVQLPERIVSWLAQVARPEEVFTDAPAWLLACGLALHEIGA